MTSTTATRARLGRRFGALTTGVLTSDASTTSPAALTSPDTPPAADEGMSFRDRFAGGALEVWSNRPLRAIVTLTLVLVTLVGFGQAAYAYYLVEFLGVPTAVLGLVFVALGVGGVLGSVTVHAVSARLGRRTTLHAGVLLVAAGFGVVGLAPAASLAGGLVTRADPRLPRLVAAVGSAVAIVLLGGLVRVVDDADGPAPSPTTPEGTTSAPEGTASTPEATS